MIDPEQIRAARALLGLERCDLARLAGVPEPLLAGAEETPGAERWALERIREALQGAGVDFIEGGVRRHRPEKRDPERLYGELLAIAERSRHLLAGSPKLEEPDLYGDRGFPV